MADAGVSADSDDANCCCSGVSWVGDACYNVAGDSLWWQLGKPSARRQLGNASAGRQLGNSDPRRNRMGDARTSAAL